MGDGNLGMGPDERGGGMFGPPDAGQVPQGIGYAGKGGQAAGMISSVLAGLRQGHLAKMAQQYGTLERQYRIANSQYQAAKAQYESTKNPDDAEAMRQAYADLQTTYQDLMSFGGGGKSKGGSTKGKMSTSGQEQGPSAKEKISGILKRILLGPEPQIQPFPMGSNPPPAPGATPSGPPTTLPLSGSQQATAMPYGPRQTSQGAQGIMAPPTMAGAQKPIVGSTMNYRGRPVRVTATYPDGTVDVEYLDSQSSAPHGPTPPPSASGTL